MTTTTITATLPIVIDDRVLEKECARVPEAARRELVAKTRTNYFQFNDIFGEGLRLGGGRRVGGMARTSADNLLPPSFATWFGKQQWTAGGSIVCPVTTKSKTLVRKAGGAWFMKFVWQVKGPVSVARAEVLAQLRGAVSDGWGEGIEQVRRFGPPVQPYERPGKPDKKTDGRYGFHLSRKGIVISIT